MFTNCHVLDRPNVIVWGMQAGHDLLLWLQNRDSNWSTMPAAAGRGPGRRLPLPTHRLPDGHYSLQWWETWKGRILSEEEADVTDGHLTIQCPPLRTDVAIKLLKK